MKKGVLWLFPFLLLCSISSGYSQSGKKTTRQEYIEIYKDIAIEEMKRTGIPASITLAQGVLESGNGNSRLARKGNNHFGIKCHDWNGKKIRHDDDARNECFRKYKSAFDSYRDHSDFLTSKQRYSSLFTLESTDYKEWARGLKKAGYATSRNYDKALIKIIEENELYAYDQGVEIEKQPGLETELADKSTSIGSRKIFETNRINYIIAKTGDTYTGISEELDLLPWELRKYNELSEDSKIDSGQVLYIQPKRKKAEIGNNTHIVDEGETMYSISQLYGIKLNELYRKNLMEEGTEPVVTQTLQLRKGLKMDKEQLQLSLKEQKDDKEEAEENEKDSKEAEENEKDSKEAKQKAKQEDEIEFEFDFSQD